MYHGVRRLRLRRGCRRVCLGERVLLREVLGRNGIIRRRRSLGHRLWLLWVGVLIRRRRLRMLGTRNL